MSRDCEICRDSRIVRLPIYRPATAKFDASAAVAIEQNWREYPCPECAEMVPQERIAVLDAHAMVDDRPYGSEFDEHVRRSVAHRLVDHLLSIGYITFERGKSDPQCLRYPMVATLGVVAPGKVAALEDRIKQRQGQLAAAVADEAIRQIDNWGSHYGYTNIEKGHVRRLLRESVKSVSEAWSKAFALTQRETTRG